VIKSKLIIMKYKILFILLLETVIGDSVVKEEVKEETDLCVRNITREVFTKEVEDSSGIIAIHGL